jgi:DNA-binding MarR family transcriptional regulator
MTTSSPVCAQAVLEAVPAVMRFIRSEMRSQRADLSVPQFRALMFIAKNEGSSLQDVARHLGLRPPSTSKLIDVLERRALVTRRPSREDRRRITLGLTSSGSALRRQALAQAQRSLAARLDARASSELRVVMEAMSVLGRTFPAAGPPG